MRVTCPYCQRIVSLQDDDTMYDHTTTGTSSKLCPGSGEHL